MCAGRSRKRVARLSPDSRPASTSPTRNRRRWPTRPPLAPAANADGRFGIDWAGVPPYAAVVRGCAPPSSPHQRVPRSPPQPRPTLTEHSSQATSPIHKDRPEDPANGMERKRDHSSIVMYTALTKSPQPDSNRSPPRSVITAGHQDHQVLHSISVARSRKARRQRRHPTSTARPRAHLRPDTSPDDLTPACVSIRGPKPDRPWIANPETQVRIPVSWSVLVAMALLEKSSARNHQRHDWRRPSAQPAPNLPSVARPQHH